jgi:hypothetical protein
MGTNTGIGIGIGIPFKNNALGGDRPYLPPELKARLIGVWDNYGKKNTDADRNIIKNKIPNAGGDLEILNAAYRLNSGFGGYSNDFQEYTYHENVVIKTDTNVVFNAGGQLLIPYSSLTKDVPSFKIKVSGLSNTYHFRYYYRDNNGVQHSVNMAKDGNYELPICYNVQNSSDGTDCGFANNGSDIITVEILPAFEGALVTDGINDIIASIKTLEEWNIGDKGITIVSMIHQINTNTNNFITTNNIRTDNKVIGRNIVSNIEKTGIYGWYKENIQSNTINVINNILGDKNDYISHSSPSTNINPINNSKFYVQGYAVENNFTEISSIAHYWTFAVLGKATEDEINLIIAYFNLDRTLKPDIRCNIERQGITNDNHADFNDKLIDYSGNGRDIQMYNLAWKGGSGIAAKPFETIKDYTILPDEARQKLTIYNEFSYKIKSNTPGYYWTVQSIIRDNTLYQVTIITDKDCYWINSTSFINSEGNKESIRKKYPVLANTPTQVIICGLDQFEYPEGIEPTSAVSYVNLEYAGEITITFIPSCKGGILLDGINDFGKVIDMPIYKDYTFIIDRQIISIGDTAGIVASKSEDSTDVNKQGAFLFEYLGAPNNISAWSFYKNNGKVANTDFTRGISYQSTYSYNGIELLAGTTLDSDKLWLGMLRDKDSRFANVAIYSLMSFPYTMSKFLIERQLKKYKLGTLYPNMVEFRPVINSNVLLDSKPTFVIRGTNTYLNAGDYVPENSQIWISIKMNNIADRITKFTVNGKTIDIPENAYSEVTLQYGFPFVIDKSPQKIGITIEQDENYVLFNPVINSNYDNYKLTFHLREYEKLINIGDYIPKGTYIRANLYLKNNIDELVTFTFNGVNIDYAKSPVLDTAYNIRQIYNYDSPQEVNITIDEYIRYEDIDFTNCYPGVPRIYVNDKSVTWGDKLKVGDEFTFYGNVNILPKMYNVLVKALYNGEEMVYGSIGTISKSMVFTSFKTYLLDNNEPKCILSPRLLRIPNSSYKILGYIPDISGHGNHGVIHNSAYAEGSGVNEDGSYQFDGVDDFVTIPTIVGGKQVLMKVNWQSNIGDAILYDQRFNVYNYEFAIYNSNTDNYSENPHAYSSRNNGKTYIDGILNTYIKSAELQNVTHNITATNELSSGSIPASPIIGSNISHDSAFAQMTLYDFMLFDEISTEAKIKELNTYIGITPKVTLPNYYWDNYGKKNTDANRGHVDEQVSLQKTGTSVNPLENFNISYEGMSGYNGYPVVFGASKTWESLSGVYSYTSNVTNTTIHVTHAEHAGNGLLFSYVKKDGALVNIKEIPAFRVTIGGLEGNSKFGYRYLATEDATEETLVYLGNGTHELAKSFAPTEALLDLTSNVWVGIFITPMIEGEVVFDCDITIEVLPEYENGLAYDGVSDFSQNTEIEVVEDFTFLVKGSLLKGLTGSGGCIARKGDKKHYDTGGYAFIYCFDSPIESYRNSYYSFGKSFVPSKEIVAPPLIGYMTKTNVNGETTTFGTNSDIKGIIFGNWSSGYMNMVIYKSIFYTKTISLLEINFLKNLMEKDEIIDINHPIFISNTEDESNTSQDT